jgi:hypothetical protein
LQFLLFPHATLLYLVFYLQAVSSAHFSSDDAQLLRVFVRQLDATATAAEAEVKTISSAGSGAVSGEAKRLESAKELRMLMLELRALLEQSSQRRS